MTLLLCASCATIGLLIGLKMGILLAAKKAAVAAVEQSTELIHTKTGELADTFMLVIKKYPETKDFIFDILKKKLETK